MLEYLTNENHVPVVEDHLAAVAPQLQRLDAAIASTDERQEAELLRTMRIYLASGLFDADYYIRTQPDIREASNDALEHFVRNGEAEGRRPNPIAWETHSRQEVFGPRYEFEARGRRDQYALMRVKRALRQILGREEAFACYRLVAGLSAGERILPRRIGSLYQEAAACRGAFHEIAPGGELFRIALPSVLGQDGPCAVESSARAAFVACLINARLRGGSAAIEKGDEVFFDFERSERAVVKDQLDYDLSVFEADEETAWLISGNEEETPEIEEAFSLIGPHSDTFASWLLEYLPKYIMAVDAHAIPPVPLLIDADIPKVHYDALALLLSLDVPIIEQSAFASVWVRRLWCAPSLAYAPVQRERRGTVGWEKLIAPPRRVANIFATIARQIERRARATEDTDKLFLASRQFPHYRLHDACAIHAIAAERGFRVLYPEDGDFAWQVGIVRAARYIVATEGSALFLALFARPGTQICILSSPDIASLAMLIGPLAEIGVKAAIVTGPRAGIGTGDRDEAVYQIDVEFFEHLLDSWLRGEALPTHLVPPTVAPTPTLSTAARAGSVVVVLGMHRSGTSLCAHILSTLGIEMSDTIEPVPSNPSGQWERLDLRDLQDRVLDLFDRGCQSPNHDLPIPSEWWGDTRVHELREQIQELLRQRMASGKPFGFKDPRTARLLPMWRQIFRTLNVVPKLVLCLRNPAQVALSLEDRDGLDSEVGEFRWFVYMTDIFRNFIDERICVIEYEDWFTDSERNLRKLVTFLDLDLARPHAAFDIVTDNIIDERLRHDDPRRRGPYHPIIRSCYELARVFANDLEARQKISKIVQEFDMIQQLQRPLRRKIEGRFS